MANAWRASVFPPNWFDPHAWDAGKPPESTEDYMARKMEEVEMVMPIYDNVINPRVHLPPRNQEEHARYEDAALRFIRSFDVEERTRGWLQHMQKQVEQVVADCAVPRTSRRVELIYL